MVTALRDDAEKHFPLETGGALLGYWCGNNEAVVQEAIGPGPHAVHRKTSFCPDADWQHAQMALIYKRSGRRTAYLGDWHTHPTAEHDGLSWIDRRAIKQVAQSTEARAPAPLMGLMYGGPSEWRCTVWRGYMRTLGICWLKTQRCAVEIYET
jgi:integrative and conjugative element protein (TIGR02256 family)